MRFEDLELFVTVVQEGNFSSAARRLHLSQPGVTRRIAYLEKELATPLLIREARGAAPTASGKVLYEEALGMLQGLENIKQRIQAETQQPVGPLVMMAGDASGTYLAPLLLTHFKRRNPLVLPRLVIQATQKTVKGILEQECNLGIVPFVPDDPRLEATPLCEDELCMIVPEEHPLADRDVVDPKELVEYPIVIRRVGARIHSTLEQGLQRAGVDFANLTVAAEADTNEALKQMVIVGGGIGFADRMSLRNDRGGYRVIRLLRWDTRRVFQLIRRVEEFRSYAEQAFWDYCQTEEARRLLADVNATCPSASVPSAEPQPDES